MAGLSGFKAVPQIAAPLTRLGLMRYPVDTPYKSTQTKSTVFWEPGWQRDALMGSRMKDSRGFACGLRGVRIATSNQTEDSVVDPVLALHSTHAGGGVVHLPTPTPTPWLPRSPESMGGYEVSNRKTTRGFAILSLLLGSQRRLFRCYTKRRRLDWKLQSGLGIGIQQRTAGNFEEPPLPPPRSAICDCSYRRCSPGWSTGQLKGMAAHLPIHADRQR